MGEEELSMFRESAKYRELRVDSNGFSGARYTQLLDPGSKSARMKSEDGGGAALAIDLPAGLLKNLEDTIPFHL